MTRPKNQPSRDHLNRKLDLLSRALECLNEMVIITDLDHTIIYANQAIEKILNYAPDEVIGLPAAEFFRDIPGNPPDLGKMIATQTENGTWEGDIFNRKKDGSLITVHLSLNWIRDDSGRLIGSVGVAGDITDRKQAEENLKRARISAEAASRAKSEFLANMSHELRTPLNGVIGMTDLLLESPLAAEQREYIETIRASGNSLLSIIRDVLDYSALEDGKLELESFPFRLTECVRETINLVSPASEEKGLHLRYRINPDVPSLIRGDASALKRLLFNLIDNAVKFTEKGEVVVAVENVGQHVPRSRTEIGQPIAEEKKYFRLRFSVRDTGIGIPADRLEELFHPFTQADSSLTRKFGGLGLGLALAGKLVRLMGGEIQAKSKPGRGSTFFFTIPVRTEEGVRGMDHPIVKDPAGTADQHDPEIDSRLARRLPLQILIAEDNAVNLKLAVRFLEKLGYRADSVVTGLEAVEAVTRKRYDIVFMDVQMPEMSGLEATRVIIKRCSPIERPRIIAMTAFALKGDREACIKAGMDDYISKPIRIEEVRQALERWGIKNK